MDMPHDSKLPPIAIVGIAALFPRSATGDVFWRHILAGKDLITDVPPGHWLIEDYFDPDPARVKPTPSAAAFSTRCASTPLITVFHPPISAPPTRRNCWRWS
jgi:hypothetical protein